MVTAVYAARNIAAGGTDYDVWDVNVEDDYHEEVRTEEVSTSGERLVPARAPAEDVANLIRDAFARYDAVALGTALASVGGVGLLVATAVLLLRGGPNVGANLSLLGNFLPGFTIDWWGAVVGSAEVGLLGFAFGWALAKLINGVIRLEESNLLRQVEGRALDLFEGGD